MSAPFDRAEAYRTAGWSGTLAFEPRKKFPPPGGSLVTMVAGPRQPIWPAGGRRAARTSGYGSRMA